MTHFDNQYDEPQEIESPTKHKWYNIRIEEMEEKAGNMGLSFSGPDYIGQEEAYVRCMSNRLRYLLEDPYFHMDTISFEDYIEQVKSLCHYNIESSMDDIATDYENDISPEEAARKINIDFQQMLAWT